MRVKDVMRTGVVAVPQTASLRDLLHLFIQHRLGTLPVVDAAGKVVGLVSVETLIALFLPRYDEILKDYAFLEDYGTLEPLFVAQFQLVDEDRLFLVADAMTPRFLSVEPQDSLLKAAALMHTYRTKLLPVVDPDHRLVGLLSHIDIVLSLLAREPVAATGG